ncbi:MAG TPA: response regulator, partial [Candidatus Polarisedimenticolia bacterium]|nr:response regulator [Candidatus Polarisedimenticolia bacterium]
DVCHPEEKLDRVRVLIVDENCDFIEGVSAWFGGHPSISIVGSAHTVVEAILELARLRPDLVLVDARTRPAGGFDATRRFRELHPGIVIVMTSIHGSAAVRRAVAEAGADHFLEKSQVAEGLAEIVRGMLGKDQAQKKTSG